MFSEKSYAKLSANVGHCTELSAQCMILKQMNPFRLI